MAGLEKLAPNFDWKTYYRAAGYPAFTAVNVDSPDFYKQVNAKLASEPIANWKTYLRFHVVDAASPYLSQAFVDENFQMYRKYLRGAKEQQPRWKRCVSYVDHNLDDALSQVYVAKVFSSDLKQQALDMVQRIEAAMEQRINQLDWMSPATKAQALVKLHGIRNKIGYPDKWRDYSALSVSADDLIGNVIRANGFEYDDMATRLGKPVDRSRWGMTPQTVNAYYNPVNNEIVFPAAILQPPFFNPAADDAVNYGGIGAVIGHEISHGFDDQGAKSDGDGNLRDAGREHRRPERPRGGTPRLPHVPARQAGPGNRRLHRRPALLPRLGAGLADQDAGRGVAPAAAHQPAFARDVPRVRAAYEPGGVLPGVRREAG
jgi:putative endopeptidase